METPQAPVKKDGKKKPVKPSDANKKSHLHWAQLSEAGGVMGIRLLLSIYRMGGPLLFRIALFPAISYFFLFRHQARRASYDYLRHVRAFAPQHANQWIAWQSFRQFWNFGLALIDKLAVWNGEIKLHHITRHQRDIIDQMVREKRGGILLVSHLGNFEICRCLSAAQGDIRLTVLLHTKHAEKFNRLLNEQDNEQGNQPAIEVLQVTEITPATAMLLSERIERGEFIAIAADRVAIEHPENSLMVDFMGQRAPLPKGPFVLAAILRAPILTVFSLWQADGYHIYFDQLSGPVHAPRKQRSPILSQLAQRYAHQLQDHCIDVPLQWFNFFHFWNLPATHASSKGDTDNRKITPKASSKP